MIRTYIIDTTQLGNKQIYDRRCAELSAERLKRLDFIGTQKNKILSLGAGVLISVGFKAYGIDENEVSIVKNEYGKPYIKDGDLFFNVSHSGTMAVCSFADREVGTDIQILSRPKLPEMNLKLAERFFTHNEFVRIRDIKSVKEQNEEFTRLWTIKESFVKACGYGFNLNPNEFEVSITNGISVSHKVNNKKYFFKEYEVQGYKLTVCCEKDDFAYELEYVTM